VAGCTFLVFAGSSVLRYRNGESCLLGPLDYAPRYGLLISALAGTLAIVGLIFLSRNGWRFLAGIVTAFYFGGWLWLLTVNGMDRQRLQEVYRLERGLPAAAPLPRSMSEAAILC
jgi:hypothetical protein